MKIIKRNGSEAVFDITKIIAAITKANKVVPDAQRLTKQQIIEISDHVQEVCYARGHAMNVEEIQDIVEDAIMATGAYEVARRYITYRYVQSLKRTHNTTDDKILSLIECNNEEVKQENSNKNPTVNSVQRDYMAGEVSKDLTMRMLLPPEIVKAHEEGIIHFHDADYYAQHMHNCDLVNLDDMLQNGTVISGTLIEKPHSFSTACNIATQIIAQVASSQYGGQSISLTHLAPFVDVSRKKIRRDVEAEMKDLGIDPGEEKISEIVEKRLREEIKRGVQTIQYQVVTLMTTNGQAPFITVFMYLNEAKSEQEKKDLAMIIEETLRQRYEGVKNEKGVWITPAFPKLIYVLEEDNVREGTPYWYLTRLAAQCTAKRMVPDYISEKKMREYKLSKGETIVVPKFEFARQMRNDHLGTPLRLKKNEIAIFEGIHALNDACAGRNPAATCLYISARSDVLEGEDLRFKGTWMRLTRRAVRDYNFRGTGVGETMDMWANVRRGEKLYISPFKHRANYIFDSSLPYEVSVMKHYAMPLLEAVPQENVRRRELLDLIHGFEHFLPIDPALVPPASLLREFIGGGIYDYT